MSSLSKVEASTKNGKQTPKMPTEGDLVAFEHGAAGHQGINTDASGSLLIKPCTQAEIDFYESAKDHPEFQVHLPTYIGSLTLNNDPAMIEAVGGEPGADKTTQQNKSDWKPSGGKKLSTGLAIVLENATAGFKCPNVLDLKLGARLWDDDAPEAKRKKLDEVAADTTSGSMGFRIAGMKTWLGEEASQQANYEVNTEIKDGFKSFNKLYGRSLNEKNIHKAFEEFLGGHRVIAKRLLREIESIQSVLEHEESRMYSASILIVYEGDNSALEDALKYEADHPVELRAETDEDGEEEDKDEDEEAMTPRVLEVKLIDFAHASWKPGQGPDENALRGVRSIKTLLKEFLQRRE